MQGGYGTARQVRVQIPSTREKLSMALFCGVWRQEDHLGLLAISLAPGVSERACLKEIRWRVTGQDT